MTLGIEKYMEKNKKGPAGDLVDQWNIVSNCRILDQNLRILTDCGAV